MHMKTWQKTALVVILFLTSIAIAGYVYRESPIMNSLFAATSDCTQINQYGYYGFKSTNDVCNKSGISATCGGNKYCCQAPGKKWVIGACTTTVKRYACRDRICKEDAGGPYTTSTCGGACTTTTTTPKPVCIGEGKMATSAQSCCQGLVKEYSERGIYYCVSNCIKENKLAKSGDVCCAKLDRICDHGVCYCIKSSTTQTCTNIPSGSNWSLNSSICDKQDKTIKCSSVDYCCPSRGEKWVKCSSVVIPKPITTTPPKPIVTITQPTQAPPPPEQKSKPTKPPKPPALLGCYDYGCVSLAQGNLWGLVNCGVADPDGDMQLCDGKGRIGQCQAQKQCCPGSGQKWTTDMTACPVTEATLTVSPTDLAAGSALSVTWSSIPGPSATDWLGMYKQGETDERNTVEWNYVNSTTCTKTTGDGKASGTCSFTLPTNIVTATYELRLYSNNTFTKLATSNLFTVKGTTTGECCACPTPTPSYLQSMCNGPCMTSNNCPTGQVCLLADTYGWVCRNPACADTASCSCSASLLTPTPTQKVVEASCDEECSSTSGCPTGYQCVYINDQNTAVCRNPKCYSSRTCVCPKITPTIITKGTETTPTASASGTPTGLRLNAFPTPSPIPGPIPVNPILTVKPVTDSTGKAPSKFTLSGTSDPFTEIDIRFDPDSIGQTTSADAKGDWRYILTKALTTGKKDLTVTARSADGGETQVKQSFTVKGGSSFFSLFLGFLILAAIGGIGFYIYQKQMKDQSSLFSQFPPFTPSTEETESTTSPEKSKVSPESPSETPPPEPFISSETGKPSPGETKESSEETKPPFS